MRLDLMPGRVQGPQRLGVGVAGGRRHEERGGRAVGGQDGQQRGGAGAGAVVEGQGDARQVAGTGAQGAQPGGAAEQVRQDEQRQPRPGQPGPAVQESPAAGVGTGGNARRNSR
ncbi:hypothetical protein GCM10008937_00210 [Deinococcus depolymerans]|uniref:Uncharacterized protein n=1 Tax=Deinococcus depolymerans TaxID=392408 RepID=A0ABN1BG64_9DEIO